jgi:dCMP deaminase
MSKIDDISQVVRNWDNRPEWNEHFMSLAILTSSRSPCSRLHVGCVLVKDKRIVSMGYNGFLTGEEHKSVVQEDHSGKKHELATIHAEQNAISYGANTGVALKETIAYITHYPCLICAKLLVSCGIKIVYYHEDYNNDPLVPIICTQLQITKI